MKCSQKLKSELANAVVLAITANKVQPLTWYQSQGLSDTRYRWDCMWASGFDVNRLYDAGLNDNHIETALKSIITGH